MNELQRQAYLEAMEVDSYFPRLQLPGALASTLFEMPAQPEVANNESSSIDELIQESAHTPAHDPTQKQEGSRVAALHALFDDTSSWHKKNQSTPKSDMSVETASNISENNSSTLQFSLSIIRGQNILIVDEGLQGHVNPAEYLQLIKNILIAIGAGKQQLSIDSFVWPMVKNSPFDQSEVAAKETLISFLNKQSLQLKSKYLLLMGTTAVRYIDEQELSFGQLLEIDSLPVQLIRTESAEAVLTNPTLKPLLWQQLQALVQALQ